MSQTDLFSVLDAIYNFRSEYVAHQDRKLSDPEFAKQPLLKEGIKIVKFLLFVVDLPQITS
ncbi:MAG: hypothetical protein DRG66_04775 [Deltaproteobacteria bacterium]|nr:MAG: hypothetical protein DRG66_04775 [Deltaproteobacteria bacterium]